MISIVAITIYLLAFALFLYWHVWSDRKFRAYMDWLQNFLRNEREP